MQRLLEWSRVVFLALVLGQSALAAQAPPTSASLPAASAGLEVARAIPLANLDGRIDHVAFDHQGQRLFVAGVGSGQLVALEFESGREVARCAQLDEPQGVAWLPAQKRVAVACGGEGAVRFFEPGRLEQRARVACGGDADNLRLDPSGDSLWVGIQGGLACIDLATFAVRRTVVNRGHSEGFQLEPDGLRAWVNVPDERALCLLDLAASSPARCWTLPDSRANYPMALDAASGSILLATRSPAQFQCWNRSGELLQSLPSCGDADDLFFDAKRQRAYLIGGAGQVDAFQRSSDGHWSALPSSATAPGARTGLWIEELDLLLVAAPARATQSAQVLVLRPLP